ncbi:MAG: hypothetical protein R3B09_08790 [Nannocystaceae bacterium]
MSNVLSRPYYSVYRPLFRVSGGYPPGESPEDYLAHPRFGGPSRSDIRAFYLLERDLVATFRYIEPSHENIAVYSHEYYALLLRACTEFESHAKNILDKNGYEKKKGLLNIEDYAKLERACKLSGYRIRIPTWNGPSKIWTPFQPWSGGVHTLAWYKNYNDVKHNRNAKFSLATLDSVVAAIAANLAILYAQIGDGALDELRPPSSIVEDDYESWRNASHGLNLFEIATPSWPPEECYHFNWLILQGDSDPFEKFPFT